jgi:HK97 family phage major capsid protein
MPQKALITMAIFSTPDSAKAFHVDVEGHKPLDAIPDALILKTSTVAGFVEGDEPVVRVPSLSLHEEADYVAEGAPIPEADPDDDEVLIGTSKIALLFPVTREQYETGQTKQLFANAVRREMTRRANFKYLAQPEPAAFETRPPAGILNQHPTFGGVIDGNLDAFIDAIATIESAGGTATNILANPAAWAVIAKFKTADDSNTSLIGAGTETAQRRLLGLPVDVDLDVPPGKFIVLDNTAILSVIGNIQTATSEHYYFNRDTIAIRATWRFGAKIADPARVVVLDFSDES